MAETRKDPSQVVKGILRKRNVGLKKYIANHLPTFAAQLKEKGLIAEDIERNTSTLGVDSFTHASKLMDACSPSLTLYPKENFPKFIVVMKEFPEMQRLAKEMEVEYQKETGLALFQSGGEHFVEEDNDTGPTTEATSSPRQRTTDRNRDAPLRQRQLQTEESLQEDVDDGSARENPNSPNPPQATGQTSLQPSRNASIDGPGGLRATIPFDWIINWCSDNPGYTTIILICIGGFGATVGGLYIWKRHSSLPIKHSL